MKIRKTAAASDNARGVKTLIDAIAKAVGPGRLTAVSKIAARSPDPFKILISTILSLRTKDEVTAGASKRLFALASTPAQLAAAAEKSIREAIYPVGFYKTKAKTIRNVSKTIRDKHNGTVPGSMEELLAMKGIGRKTANLVLTLGFGIDGICVDTHVHRVSNRTGLVATKNTDDTEFELMKVLPRKYWIGYNELLVNFGKMVCKPVSPLCTECPLYKRCPRKGVKKHR